MKILIKNKFQRQAGFTLIEIMVGLVIGLIATLVIMQIFSTFEGQKRSTTGTADAQTNGTIGLYYIQREVQKAGFGLPIFDGDLTQPTSTTNNSILNCVSGDPLAPVLGVDHDDNPLTPVQDVFPISITDGGAGSDSITIKYSNPAGGTSPIPTLVVAKTNATELEVSNNLGCRGVDGAGTTGDIAVIVSGTSCWSQRITSTNAFLDNPLNSKRLQISNTVPITPQSRLTCIGHNYQVITFDVNNNELRKSGVPVISGVVDLQAQYGITAANNSNVITQWVDATALPNRNRIRAIRVAIVARNDLLEKTAVTTACSSLNSANPTGLCAWAGTVASPAPSINLAAIGGANYRYRVYEAVIPIRNLTFSGALL